jgi:hypothetical protein
MVDRLAALLDAALMEFATVYLIVNERICRCN